MCRVVSKQWKEPIGALNQRENAKEKTRNEEKRMVFLL